MAAARYPGRRTSGHAPHSGSSSAACCSRGSAAASCLSCRSKRSYATCGNYKRQKQAGSHVDALHVLGSKGIAGQDYRTHIPPSAMSSRACLQEAVHARGGQVEVGQVRRAWRQAARPAALARAAERVPREAELPQTGQVLEAAKRSDAVVCQPQHLCKHTGSRTKFFCSNGGKLCRLCSELDLNPRTAC